MFSQILIVSWLVVALPNLLFYLNNLRYLMFVWVSTHAFTPKDFSKVIFQNYMTRVWTLQSSIMRKSYWQSMFSTSHTGYDLLELLCHQRTEKRSTDALLTRYLQIFNNAAYKSTDVIKTQKASRFIKFHRRI